MRRTLARAAALALTAIVTMSTATMASAAALPAAYVGPNDGFYSQPYTDTLIWVHSTGSPGAGVSTSYAPATFAEWSSQGFPTPRPMAIRYVKAPFLSTILAVPYAPGTNNRIELWSSRTALTGEQWARVGYPWPQVTTNIPGYVLQYRSTTGDPTIWASIDSERHALTLAEWIAAGQPQPIVSAGGTGPGPAPAPTVSYQGWPTSPELFAVPSDGSAFHKLTPAEWARAGYPAPLMVPGGYYKLSWDVTIALLGPINGDVELLTPATWAHRDYPTPAVVRTIPGDYYCYDTDAEAVYYDGATVSDYLTDDEVTSFLGVDVDDVEEC